MRGPKYANSKSLYHCRSYFDSYSTNKGNETKLTSDFMAGSVGVNPVIIRKTLSQLKKADLISVQRGTGGASLLKDPEEINLLQVYRAVDSIGPSGQLFSSMTILTQPVQ